MKLSQIKPLTESMGSALKSLDVSKLTVKDLIVALDNGGYTDMDNGKYMQCVYGGFRSKTNEHLYYWLWQNDDADDQEKPYAINELWITLGKDGKIIAEPGGNPIADDMAKDEAVKKLASMKKISA